LPGPGWCRFCGSIVGARRVLEAVELVEVSLVAVPMQGLARVEVVGVARRADAFPSS